MYSYLHKDDFETKQANTANVETLIMEAVVPKDFAWYLPADPMQIFLGTKDNLVGDGATVQFQLTKDIVDTPNLGDDGGSVAAYVNNVRTAITAVNYDLNKITFGAAPGNGAAIEAYYIFGGGNLKIRAAHPNKTSGFKQLFARAIANIHTVDQYDIKTAPKIQNPFILPEKYALQLLVNSSVVVDWDAEDIVAQLAIPYKQMPMSALPADIKEKVNRLLLT